MSQLDEYIYILPIFRPAMQDFFGADSFAVAFHRFGVFQSANLFFIRHRMHLQIRRATFISWPVLFRFNSSLSSSSPFFTHHVEILNFAFSQLHALKTELRNETLKRTKAEVSSCFSSLSSYFILIIVSNPSCQMR